MASKPLSQFVFSSRATTGAVVLWGKEVDRGPARGANQPAVVGDAFQAFRLGGSEASDLSPGIEALAGDHIWLDNPLKRRFRTSLAASDNLRIWLEKYQVPYLREGLRFDRPRMRLRLLSEGLATESQG